LFFREKLGPPRTIAKEKGERKEKSRKRPEKCVFFRGHVEIAGKNTQLGRVKCAENGFRRRKLPQLRAYPVKPFKNVTVAGVVETLEM
jgi:hypothetical protein